MKELKEVPAHILQKLTCPKALHLASWNLCFPFYLSPVVHYCRPFDLWEQDSGFPLGVLPLPSRSPFLPFLFIIFQLPLPFRLGKEAKGKIYIMISPSSTVSFQNNFALNKRSITITWRHSGVSSQTGLFRKQKETTAQVSSWDPEHPLKCWLQPTWISPSLWISL